MQEIPEFYTHVPEEILPGLTELCMNHPQNSLNEVTAFILDVLRSHASYTLTPGRAPVNQDIVEYFLFENHEGYCVHFASAATLMYRLYGIPARYASGYAVAPSAFTRQEDGSWTAEVTDESAHAWTEIFLEDYGWTPVEVTPAADGSYQMTYPGLDADVLSELAGRTVFDPDGLDNEQEASSEEETAGTENEGSISWNFSIAFSDRSVLIRAAVIVLPACLAGTLIFLHLRRKMRLNDIKRMNCRRIFGRLMDMLHFAGYMSGYNGTEENFAEKLSGELPCISRTEAEQMTEIVRQAAYGQREPSGKEMESVKNVYFRTAEFLSKEQTGFSKLRFRYIKVFY